MGVLSMKRFVLLLFLLLSLTNVVSAAPGTGGNVTVKMAVVPYLDSSEQDKDYVPGIIDEGYTNYFGTLRGIVVVPAAEVNQALRAAGYDPSDVMLPDKSVMAAVAQATGADYVVAMELANLSAIRHESLFQYKISVNVKLEYHLYSRQQDTLMPFKTTGANDNATIFGDVGFKAPIKASLQQAMKKANDKIIGIMAADTMSQGR